MWLCVVATTAWMTLGSWVAIFPGTLEEITGHSYSMMDSYGVTRLRFEVFTLGTLAAVLVFGVVGYLLAADGAGEGRRHPARGRPGGRGRRLGDKPYGAAAWRSKLCFSSAAAPAASEGRSTGTS